MSGEISRSSETPMHVLGNTSRREATALKTLPVIERSDPLHASIILFRTLPQKGARPILEAPGERINPGETLADALTRTLEQRGISYEETVFNLGNATDPIGEAEDVTALLLGKVADINRRHPHRSNGRRLIPLQSAYRWAIDPYDQRIENGLTKALIRNAAQSRGIQ